VFQLSKLYMRRMTNQLVAGWTVLVSNYGIGMNFFLLSEKPWPSLVSTQPPNQWKFWFSPVVKLTGL